MWKGWVPGLWPWQSHLTLHASVFFYLKYEILVEAKDWRYDRNQTWLAQWFYWAL